MQFLAFLKDSYREAKSGWMLQIMLVLGGLLILLVASIGFRPATVGDQFRIPLWLAGVIAKGSPKYAELGRPTWAVENVTAVGDKEPWRADYAFDFVVRCETADQMRLAHTARDQHGQRLATTVEPVTRLVKNTLRAYKRVVVEPPPDPPEAAPAMAAGGVWLAADRPWAAAEERYRVTAGECRNDDPLAAPHKVFVLFFFEPTSITVSLREGVYLMEKWLVNGVGVWLLLLIAVVVTAGFVPNMLAKGGLDLIASKPISRTRLLLYKYVGGLLFVAILTTATVAGVWVVIGLRSGVWATSFLATIPVVVFYFAILYAVSTAAAVSTRNTLVAILVTGLMWAVFWVVGKLNDGVAEKDEAKLLAKLNADGPVQVDLGDDDADDPQANVFGFIPPAAFPYVKAAHAVCPRTFQLDARLGRVIAEGAMTPDQMEMNGFVRKDKDGVELPLRESWREMVGVSTAFIVLLLGISCWRFERRDY